MNKNKKIKDIEKKVQNCQKCSLYKTRKNVVFGSGNINSKIFFIGEGPGKKEDETGIPFCGRAGKILNKLLELMRLKREDVYITSVLKCRTPKNRKPKTKEVEKCSFYLEKQIEIINPEIIICLGKTAVDFIFKKFKIDKKEKMGKIRGKVINMGNKKIIPLYHPAYAIYKPQKFNIMKNDFIKLKEFL